MRAVTRFTSLVLILYGSQIGAQSAQDGRDSTAARLFEQHHLAEAKALLEPGAVTSKDAVQLYYLGRIAFEDKRYDGAISLLERSIALNPRSAAAQLWLGNANAHAAFSASIFKQPMYVSHARDAWERAAGLDPRDIDSRESLAQFYESVPKLLGGDTEKAHQWTDAVRQLSPYRGDLLSAQFAEHDKNWSNAARLYGSLVKQFPDSSRALDGQLFALDSDKKFADAFAVVDSRLATAPSDPVALYYLGRPASLSGSRTSDGLAAVNRLMPIGVPVGFRFSASGPHALLGTLYEQKGDRASAIRELRIAVQMNSKDSRSKDALDRLTREQSAKNPT